MNIKEKVEFWQLKIKNLEEEVDKKKQKGLIMKEINCYQALLDIGSNILDLEREIIELNELTQSEDFADDAQKEKENKKKLLEEKNLELKDLIFSQSEKLEGNCILEIRPGIGGEEALIFANDLMQMYLKYFLNKKLKIEVLETNQESSNKLRNCSFLVKGKEAYKLLFLHAGVHRVQRIPLTESQGRVHTSTASVVILREPPELDLEIDPKEIRLDLFCASGAGGQHVNKTQSAVRLTHLPTGLVAQCQDERSQQENKRRAMKILRIRLFEMRERTRTEGIEKERQQVAGNTDRCKKSITYNYAQDRITDHRYNLKFHQIEEVLQGNIDHINLLLYEHYKQEKIEELTSL